MSILSDVHCAHRVHQHDYGGVHQSSCWCASPGVSSYIGRPCGRLHGSGQVCFITGDTSGLRGPSPLALTLFRTGWVYRLAPKVPLFRGMPTGPKTFLKMPGACWLRPCALTHLNKALCHTRPVGGPEDKCCQYCHMFSIAFQEFYMKYGWQATLMTVIYLQNKKYFGHLISTN